MNKLPEKLIKTIEKADFSIIHEEDNFIYFRKYSPYGRDFGFDVEAASEKIIVLSITTC